MRSIRLLDYLERIADSGVNLSGCIIQGPSHRYKFHEINEDRELRVFYGGAFENIGTLSDFMCIQGVSATIHKSLDVRLKNGNITLRCRSEP